MKHNNGEAITDWKLIRFKLKTLNERKEREMFCMEAMPLAASFPFDFLRFRKKVCMEMWVRCIIRSTELLETLLRFPSEKKRII
jgi:hypothetical protein